jgi:glycosyltransferase involved in cell wall biosynthesis
MSRGVIVVAPPWPRSGSGNLFAAQTAAHVRSGARVFLLLAPIGRGFSRSKRRTWEDAVSAMRFPGVETVAYPRVSRRRVRSYLQWLRAGRDDYIAISARYAAEGRLPGELAAFVASTCIDLIHANHVYTLPLAQRVALMVQRVEGRRPRILLDTHDIQSHAVAARRQRNPHSRRPDPQEDLLKTELALCAQADALVHLTEADFAFFSSRLPASRHAVILPTLHPETEAELVRHRGVSRPAEFDFIYVGNQHAANLETVRWLLTEVLPLTAPDVRDRVRIAGSVGDLLGRRDPVLFARYRHLFCGEVPSLLDLYTGAKAVLAPAVAGTGTSIKLIEALCIGKPILTTNLALRGLPAGAMTGPAIHVHDEATDVAEVMTGLSEGRIPATPMPAGNAALYDRLFSNARDFAALASIVDESMGRNQARLEAR